MKHFLSVITCLVIIAPQTMAQSICTNATRVNALPFTSSPPLQPRLSTCGQGDFYTNLHHCANAYSAGEDYIFEYTAPANNICINLSLSAAPNDPIQTSLFVTKGCPDDANSECIAQRVNYAEDNLPKSANINNLQLEPNETYYFVVSSTNDCYDFDLTITEGVGCAPAPVGWNCNTAEEIPAIPFVANRTNCNGSDFLNKGNLCGLRWPNERYQDEGTFYMLKYTAPQDMCVDITAESEDASLNLTVYDTCPTIEPYRCVFEGFFDQYGPNTESAYLEEGKTYYFAFSSDECTAFDFTVSSNSVEGFRCENPIIIPNLPYVRTNMSTKCMGDDYEIPYHCETYGWIEKSGNDVVFKYTSNGDECITIEMEYSPITSILAVYKDCPSDSNNLVVKSTYCQDVVGDPIVILDYFITDPGDYYVVVADHKFYWQDAWMYRPFDFTLRIFSSAGDSLGTTCQNAEAIEQVPFTQTNVNVMCKGNDYKSGECSGNIMDGSDYVYSFTADESFCGRAKASNVIGEGGVTIFEGCPDLPTSQCIKSSYCRAECPEIAVDHEFEIGKTYYIIASASNGNNFSFDFEFTKSYDTENGCKICDEICQDCENAGFEKASLENWNGHYGTYEDPSKYSGFRTGYINQTFTRHTIVNANSNDPILGNLLKSVGPYGDNYALRLGNEMVNAQGEQISYSLNVTTTNQNFFYAYALVFEDALHTPDIQPYFSVTLTDENGLNINCAEYRVSANQGSEFNTFDRGDGSELIVYKDWSLVGVPLQSYIGQTVTITFTTKDCSGGAHFGYAYIDAFCGEAKITTNGASKLCPGQTVELVAPAGFDKYQWSTGETNDTIRVNAAGTYSVSLTPFKTNAIAVDCPKLDLEYEVEIAPAPNANFTFDIGCKDSIIDFTTSATSGGAGFSITEQNWDFDNGLYTDTGDFVSQGFPGPGNYDVQLVVVNNGGCRDTVIQNVTIDDYPTLTHPNLPDTLFTCIGSHVSFSSEGNANDKYSWTGPNNFTSNQKTFNLTASQSNQKGWYQLHVEHKDDPCLTTQDSTYLWIQERSAFTITPNTTICFSDSILSLQATGGVSYNWLPSGVFDNNTLQNPTGVFTAGTDVAVQITDNYCPDTTLNTRISVDLPAEPLAELTDTAVCMGMPVSIQSNLSSSFQSWKNHEQQIVEQGAILVLDAITEPQIYTLYAYLGNNQYCVYDSTSIQIGVHAIPEANISPTSGIACENDSIFFTAQNAMASFYWTDENTDTLSQSQALHVKASNTSYYLDYNDAFGCSNRDTAIAEEIVIKTPQLGTDKTLCLGDNYTLSVTNSGDMKPAFQYEWNTGATTKSITVNTTGTYILKVRYAECWNSDTVAITFDDPANFSIGNDTLLCETDGILFDFTGTGESIIWSDGATDFVRWIKPPSANYEVEITSGACVLKDDINISFEDFIPTQLPNDTALCEGETLTLTANTTGQNHLWEDNNVEISQANTISIDQAGDHHIKLNSSTAVCSSSDSMLVTVLSPNTLNFTDQHFCASDSAFINASIPYNGATYVWGDGYQGATRWIKEARSYSIQITAGPCNITGQLTATHDAVPTFDLGSDISICEDQTATLAPDNISWPTYTWQDGSNTSSKTSNTEGWHYLTAINGLCSFTDSVQLLVDTIPTFNLGADITLCENEDTIITTGITNPNITHLWNTTATTSAITIGNAGNYSVTATNGQCTFSDNLNLTIQNLPNVDLGSDILSCIGDEVSIGFTTTGATYLWNTGATTDSITVTNTGKYILTVTQGLCKQSDSLNATFDILNKPNLGDDLVQCNSIAATLNANTTAPNFEWLLDGNTLAFNTQSISINQAGTYVVKAIKGTCEEKDTVVARIQQAPTYSMSNDSILCKNESYTIGINSNASQPSYLWSTGESSQQITVTQSGVYQVILTDGVCSVSGDVDVVFVPHPYVDLDAGATICEGDTISIGAFFENIDTNRVHYQWNTGEDTAIIKVWYEGRFIQTTNIEHCFSSDYFDLELTPKPVPNMTPNFATCADNLLPISTGLAQLVTTWNTGETGVTITPKHTGWYVATIVDGTCTVVDSVEVTIHPVPNETLGDFYVCPKDSVTLTLESEQTTAIWNGVEQVSFTAYPPKQIQLELINDWGCKASQTIRVYTDKNCPDDLYVPNSFTPNGDGVNDHFIISLDEKNTFESFKVYDRWGQLVYSAHGIYKPWKGTKFNNPVMEGVYPYTIKYKDQYGIRQVVSGHITLLR